MQDKSTLVRVALNKAGEINIDPTGRMHGRAAYLCKTADCLQKAQKSKGLERSFKRSIPQEIYATLIQSI